MTATQTPAEDGRTPPGDAAAAPSTGEYAASWESLRTHRMPDWFRDAKVGIMVTWTPTSVPAWAPVQGDLPSLLREHGDAYYFANNPYAEWYGNSMRIVGSPSARHHEETYGADFPYEQFGRMFGAAASRCDPTHWADVFAAAGARYAVLVTKHHDGYLLWPSRHQNPKAPDFHADRDFVGLVADAVRARGMRFGAYYSGGLDWTWNRDVIRDIPTQLGSIVQDPAYAQLADDHWLELIDRYRPDILWGDIGYPKAGELEQVFARFYNTVADGIINDRFAQEVPVTYDVSEMVLSPANLHNDFVTPEYSAFDSTRLDPWESTRGIGFSFGYNAAETEATHMTLREMVHLLANVVSRNGNLLLGVGPMADGTIPTLQLERLARFGRWLCVNGDAIYGTRPWIVCGGTSREGIPVRYTTKGGDLFAILLADVGATTVSIEGVRPSPGSALVALDSGQPVRWQFEGNVLTMTLPAAASAFPARVVRIQGGARSRCRPGVEGDAEAAS